MDRCATNTSPLLATSATYTKDKFLRFPWKRGQRMRLFYNRRFRRILFGTFIFLTLLFCLIFIVVPFVFRNSYSLQRSLLFLNFVNNKTNLKSPIKHGVVGARNVYVESEDGIQLGVWHILPKSKLVENLLRPLDLTDDVFEKQMNSGDPIFIYLHGNAGNRAAKHRIELYKVLQNNNYHVVAVDYRSYGDSSSDPPDELGVVSDAKTVFAWVKRIAPTSNVFIWGHSLGTGISSHALRDLELGGSKAAGLVLEAPFTNLQDEIRDYPMSQLFRPLPWFDYFFVDPTYDNKFRFSSDVYLRNVTAPILILHAEDDKVVPHHLGKTLYEKVKSYRAETNKNSVEFVSFNKDLHLGHQDIYLARNLPQIVSNFVNKILEEK